MHVEWGFDLTWGEFRGKGRGKRRGWRVGYRDFLVF